MPALLETLVDDPAFGLTLLTGGTGSTVVEWVHNSDLEDPTPFLDPGQLLLTTGRQFAETAEPSFYRAYVERLTNAGVVGLGFGTEVIREGTPPDLIHACADAGLSLIEIPYRTPFIAISRWVGEVRSADERARVDWALAAQNAVSLAALGNGGLSAAVSRAAIELASDIELFDPDGEPFITHGQTERSVPSPPSDVAGEVARLLRGQRRARTVLTTDTENVTVQTLGGSQRLRGAMVLRRAEAYDTSEMAVVTTLTALAEVSLEHSQDLRTSLRALMAELFLLLKDGHVDAVRKSIDALPAGLPGRRFLVVKLDIEAAAPSIRDSLERRAAIPQSRMFILTEGTTLTLLVERRTWASIQDLILASLARVGVSGLVDWDQLDTGLVQAARALDRSAAAQITEFSELVKTSFFGLLSSASVAEVAYARLAPVLTSPEGRALLGDATEWLRQNGQWEPAARVLGIHRHTLKSRIASLEKQLDLRLDSFQDRAELWALLAAANQMPN